MASFFDDFMTDLSRSVGSELPRDLGNMDQHLDFIIPKVIGYGEDLREKGFWQSKRWREVREDAGFHEAILHIFNDGGEYLLVLDGNVVKGSWRQLNDQNTLILDIGGKNELFDLRFLNRDFMVLSKHGDQVRKGARKYFLLAHEPVARGSESDWRGLMERMFSIWREKSVSIWAWVVFIIVVGLILFFSVR